MKKIHIDFETRAQVDIWSVGAYNYASHPNTELLCIAYAEDEGPVKLIGRAELLTYPLSDALEPLRRLAEDKDVLFYAHNALFEQLIWQFILEKEYNMPPIQVLKWRCTAAKALAVGLPKALSRVALALGAGEKKSKAGQFVMKKMCKPRGYKNGKAYFYEDPELYQQLEEYCMQDVRTERDIDNILPDLAQTEQVIWFMDQIINMRGVYVDRPLVDKIVNFMSTHEEALQRQVKKLSGGKVDRTSRRTAMLNYLKSEGVDLPDYTKATLQEWVKKDIPPHIRKLLKIRQEMGKTSTAKYKALQETTSQDNRLRDTFVYHSASTGRWGGKIVQLQNLPRGKGNIDQYIEMINTYPYEALVAFTDNLMDVFSSCIRGMFIAAPGHDLIVSDYSAIEARVLMWFCKESRAVRIFKEGADIYVDMAKRIGPSATRQLGKQVVLGCGYGMGFQKFKYTCESYGLFITDALAKKAVDTYRKTYNKVRDTWYALDRAAKEAVRSPGREIKVNSVSYFIEGDFLWCQLPSTRRLAYHKPRIKTVEKEWGEAQDLSYMTADVATKKYVRKNTYGGKLIENIVQAMARDILAWALVRAEDAGYKPVMHVHDEIVAEVPKGCGSVDEFNKIICALPRWAKGCPIKAEGWRGERYKK